MTTLIPSREELESAFGTLKNVELPSIPEVVQQASEELNKPSPNIGYIAELIEKDPVLSGQVLKIINSPYYGLKKKIESIKQSVMLLGQKQVKNILSSAGLKSAMGGDSELCQEYWDLAPIVALTASGIASYVHGVTNDEAYMTGLFLDAGTLVLLSHSAAYSAIMLKQGKYPRSMKLFEETKYQTNHATIGYLLAKSWQLPDHVALAILHHHTDTYDFIEDAQIRSLIAIAQLSYIKVFTHASGSEDVSEEQVAFESLATNELVLNPEDVDEIVSEAFADRA